MQAGDSSDEETDQYVTIGAAALTRPIRISQDPSRVWSLPLQCVARPSTAGSKVAIPGHTYADSAVRWPTYSARTGTYLDRITT
jgi:hypothetical protein